MTFFTVDSFVEELDADEFFLSAFSLLTMVVELDLFEGFFSSVPFDLSSAFAVSVIGFFLVSADFFAVCIDFTADVFEEDFDVFFASFSLGDGISTSFSLAVANLKSGDPFISANVLGSCFVVCLGFEPNKFLKIFTDDLQSFFYIVSYFSIFYNPFFLSLEKVFK